MQPFSGVDYMLLDSQLNEQERLVRETTREFVSAKIAPHVAGWYNNGQFPRDLVPELGRMGFLGANLEGWGCAEMSNVEYGLVM